MQGGGVMAERPAILIVDDKESMLKMLSKLLAGHYRVDTASSGAEAVDRFHRKPTDLVLSDIRMPDMSGMDVLNIIKQESPDTEVVLMTAYATVSQAVEAVKNGAYNYLTKPFEPDELMIVLDKALERKQLREEAQILKEQVDRKYGFPNIVGQSKVMQQAYELASKAAESDTTVLLMGESGTGKELFARAIHHASKDKRGLFMEADGGTLLLDEISELELDLQVKINRAIQEKEVRRVGDTADLPVDVRIIACTNRDLQDAMKKGLFREDLYYRLNVFPIRLPPLRERPEDIPLLVEHFLALFAGGKREHFEVEPAAMELLLNHRWPGNARELQNAIERAVVLCEDGRITPALFPFIESTGEENGPDIGALAKLPYRQAMQRMGLRVQRQYLLEVLRMCEGNVTRAAEHAGVERESFHRLMRKCGVQSDEVRRELAEKS
jgi:DNA-binding NtrC family response regulator